MSCPSHSSYQTTLVSHSNPDLCVSGEIPNTVCWCSVPPQLPRSCLRQWDGSPSSRLHDLRDQWASSLPPTPTIFGAVPVLKEVIKYTISVLMVRCPICPLLIGIFCVSGLPGLTQKSLRSQFPFSHINRLWFQWVKCPHGQKQGWKDGNVRLEIGSYPQLFPHFI